MGIRWQSGTSPTILELSMRDLGKGKVWRANIGRVIIEGAYFQFNEASNDVGFHKIVALLICTRGQFHDCALRQSNNFLLNKFIFIKKKVKRCVLHFVDMLVITLCVTCRACWSIGMLGLYS